MQLVSVGSSLGESNFHLQFTPKFRRDVFSDDDVRTLCRESFRDVCTELRIGMEACEFGPDHVHVFVSRCKNYSVPEIARRLKGASSRRIRLELWDRIKDKLWGDSFWSGGYFYRSIGSTTTEAVQYYIEHSQRKHSRENLGEEERIASVHPLLPTIF
jgi:putative transposase